MPESEFEAHLRQLRRDKLEQIVGLGQVAYPNSYAFTRTVPELRALDTAENTAEVLAEQRIEASVAGRVMAIRLQGKAGFAQLQQGGQRLQIYVRRDDVGETLFALYKLLDLGDHIGVRGFLMRTRTGELTLHAKEVGGLPALTFLTKAMLALPDKYHGLEDTELRYRQRYVDLFMNTGQGEKATSKAGADGSAADGGGEAINVREVFVKRAAVLRAVRRFFDERGFLEVETPMLHTIAGGAAARPFTTHHNALDIPLSLRIAPELFLKRLVVGGLDRVYEINRNFRNEGVSTRHNPEFTMLEFYQAYANYRDLMKLTKELVAFVATKVNTTTKIIFDDFELDLAAENWQELSMIEAIIKYWNGDLGPKPLFEDFANYSSLNDFLNRNIHSLGLDPSAWRTQPAPGGLPSGLARGNETDGHLRQAGTEHEKSIDIARALLKVFKGELEKSGSVGKVTTTIFEELAEPKLIQPTIIYDFPLAVSPLSKQKPDEPDWVERFEFYIGGFEVGNAFSELNDPEEQRRRFEAQLAERDRGDDEAHQMDEDYVRALGYGLPPTAGEGIGIDRLTMILTGSKSIRDVILFPLMRPPKAE